MNNNAVTVSILVASLDLDERLFRTIESALSQVSIDQEVIVIHGDSKQGEGRGSFYENPRVSINFIEPRGIYHALNSAISVARGEWISILGAGDIYLDTQTLSGLLLERNRTPNALIFTGHCLLPLEEKSGGNPKIMKAQRKPESIFHWKMPFPHIGTCYHRSLFETFGTFDESLEIAGDFAWVSSVLHSSIQTQLVDVVLTEAYPGGISTSGKARALALAEENAILRQFIGSSPHFGKILRSVKVSINNLRIFLLKIGNFLPTGS